MQTGYKILGVVLGALMVAGGIYCMVTPGLTFLTIGWVLGISMVADAIGNIATWFSRRKEGAADGLTLAIGIVSLLLGIALVASEGMQLAVDMMVAYMAAFWVLAVGVLRIARSLKLRRIHKELGTKIIAARWWAPLISGIVLAAIGVFGLVNPAVAAVAIGAVIGMTIVAAGANLITTACSA